VIDQPQLFIFDLDGTLIDSRQVMTQAFREAFQAVGGQGEPPTAEFLDMLGAPFLDILARLGLPAAMAVPFRSASLRRTDAVRVYCGAVAACRELRRNGYPLALLTGKDRRRTEVLLRRLDLAHLFDRIVAGDDPVAGKPSPDGIFQLSESLPTGPVDVTMVGDSRFDMMAAKAAGARAVGCAWGMTEPVDLMAAGGDVVVDRPDDLLDVLRSYERLGGLTTGSRS
jgi:3-amino-5-hydroxybenzoic acid synthesis related protein